MMFGKSCALCGRIIGVNFVRRYWGTITKNIANDDFSNWDDDVFTGKVKTLTNITLWFVEQKS